MFTLYTDRSGTFQCDIAVQNASLKGSKARLVIETRNGVNYILEGTIKGNSCTIPVKKMQGLLEKNDSGKMHLEVILENTLFSPWESDYIVNEHTSVKVSVNENISQFTSSVSIKNPSYNQKKSIEDVLIPINELYTICSIFRIRKDKKKIVRVLKEYFSINPEFIPYKTTIIKHFLKVLK